MSSLLLQSEQTVPRRVPGRPRAFPRIAYFSDLEFPSQSVATMQIVKTVEALTKQGVPVDLIVPVPWHRREMGAAQRLDHLGRYYSLKGTVRFREFHTPLPMVKRLHRPLFTMQTLKWVTQQPYDLVYVRNFMHARRAFRMGLPVLFETYRFSKSEKDIRSLIPLLNKGTHFKGVIVHSELARRYWLYLGANPAKIITVHNGVDPGEQAECGDRDSLRKNLGLPTDRPIITYAGNTDKSKGLDSIFEIARELPDFLFQIVGVNRQRDYSRLAELAHQMKLENIRMIDWLPPGEVQPYLQSSDALIIPPTSKPLVTNGNTVLPIKTFAYLASGVPVLAPRLPDTSDILEHEKNAFLLQPDRPKDNAREIKKLFSNSDLLKHIGLEGRKTAARFTWAARAEKIASFLDNSMGV